VVPDDKKKLPDRERYKSVRPSVKGGKPPLNWVIARLSLQSHQYLQLVRRQSFTWRPLSASVTFRKPSKLHRPYVVRGLSLQDIVPRWPVRFKKKKRKIRFPNRKRGGFYRLDQRGGTRQRTSKQPRVQPASHSDEKGKWLLFARASLS